jgi:hypothetical protein
MDEVSLKDFSAKDALFQSRCFKAMSKDDLITLVIDEELYKIRQTLIETI